MKVFVSSLISGMESIRDAAREAVETARSTPVMAEDFGALPMTPQNACLAGLRQSNLVLLILGERYGAKQPSGVSATHEEWREARDQKPVLVFVQEGVTREPDQQAFVEEVETWAAGRFRAGFQTPRDLRVAIGQGLRDYEQANAVGPVDEAEMVARALALLPAAQRNMVSGGPTLSVAVASSPRQQVLRPAEIEGRGLWDEMHQKAFFGPTQVFDQTKGVEKGLDGSALVLAQGHEARVRLDEQGDVLVISGFPRSRGMGGLSGLIEEDVQHAIEAALTYVGWLLERIDPTHRLTHVAVAARISGGEYMPWMTRAQMAASNGSYSMGAMMNERPAIQLVRPRPALRLAKAEMVEDLLVPLRRQWNPGGRR